MTKPISLERCQTAVICMASEYGGVNGSMALAFALRAAGWRVVYVGTPQLRDHVQARGFDYQVLEPPSGSALDADQQRQFGVLARVWPMLGRQAAGIGRMIQNHALILERERPDVVLVDPVLPILGIAPLRLNIPLVLLNPTLAGAPHPNVPPVFSHALPKANERGVSSARCTWEWARLRAGRAPGQLVSSLVSSSMGVNVERLILAAGGRTQRFEYGLKLDLPELVLAPVELDFPERRARPSRHYLGTSVFSIASSVDDELGHRLAAKQLAYASLGTLNAHYTHAERFFHALLEAFSAKPDWQLVVATGQVEPAELGSIPANVLVRRQMPQQEILAHANIFFTHGGAGSVREAIHFGVPMVVFPCGLDQNGLAARVAYHELGVRAQIAQITSRRVNELSDVARSRRVVDRVERVQASATLPEAMERGVELLERLAARRAGACGMVNETSLWYRATERVAHLADAHW